MDFSRRKFLKQISLSVALGALARYGCMPALAAPHSGLADLAQENGREFGVAVANDLIQNDRRYIQALKRDCSILVAENAMKWRNLNPSEDVYNFDGADKIIDFAEHNDLKMRYHTFIWHKSNPQWVQDAVTDKRSCKILLSNYSDRVFNHFQGRIHSWDIVNEPILIKDLQPNGMRSNLWYKAMGEEYIDFAFNLAKENDLSGDLVLNEYGLETGNISSILKRQAFLNLVRRLKDRDVPVDAIGLQSHLIGHMDLAPKDEYQNWLEDLIDTGVKIHVTELDMNDSKIQGDAPTRAIKGAAYIEEYLQRIDEVVGLKEVLMWGIWDGRSFINDLSSSGEPPAQPLLYARNWDKNPVWDSVETFLSTPP
mgnify:CR=1 FL=1